MQIEPNLKSSIDTNMRQGYVRQVRNMVETLQLYNHHISPLDLQILQITDNGTSLS